MRSFDQHEEDSMFRDLSMAAVLGLIMMCASACDKAGGEPAESAQSESTESARETSAEVIGITTETVGSDGASVSLGSAVVVTGTPPKP